MLFLEEVLENPEEVLTFWEKARVWGQVNLGRLIFSVIVILIAVGLIIIMGIIVARVNKKKNRRTYTVARLLQSIIKYTIVIIVLFVILAIWGVNVTAALAGLGIAGLIIGLGAQDIIKDFLAGIGIVFENYYEIDDIVEIGGFKGRVLEIGLRSTKLINVQGEIKIFHNGAIVEVSNFSRTFSMAIVNVTVSYTENIDKVISLLDEKLPVLKENYPQILEGPIVAGVDDLNSSGVVIRITAKTNAEEHYAVQRALKKYIKETFENNNIIIPLNQIVVHQAEKKQNE